MTRSDKLASELGILAPDLHFLLLCDASASLEGPEVWMVVSELASDPCVASVSESLRWWSGG